jgi:polysaccharide chain length determinant protein (PEP-CTERM system associated)
MEEEGFKLSDIRGILRRRLRVMLAVAGACALLAIFVSAILPNRFVSYTTMLIEPQTISKRLVEPGVEEGELTSRLHLMTMQILSRTRLSKVIDELGLYPELAGEMTREQIIEHMRSQIWVQPVFPELSTELDPTKMEFEINTFRLYFRHANAATAAAVANRLSSDFIDEHIRDRVKVSGDTAEFIESELERLAQRLREVEGQIARIKAENAGSLPEDRPNNETMLTRGLDALREAQRNLAEAQGDESFYRQQAVMARSSEGRRGDVVGKAISPALRLQELEMQLGELRSRGFTDKHPDVVMTMAEMEQLRARVDSQDPDSAPASAAEQEARGLAERASARAETERQEVERLQEEINQVHERLARTPLVAEQLDALTREYASLSESFQSYSNKRLEANVAANMERRQKGEQFRVLEAAVPSTDPESPNRILIVAFGVLLGLAMAGGLAVLLEASDSSYHEPRALQSRLGVPVLASIPGILLESDRVAMRRKRFREQLAAATVAGVMLTASVVGYLVVNRPGLLGGDTGAVAPAPTAPATAPPAGAAPPAGTAAPAPAPAPAAGAPAPAPSGG